jgi:hypothetical protein
MLVLRAWRPSKEGKFADEREGGEGYLMQAPPLAYQAGWAARGVSP